MIKDITLGQFFPGNSILHRIDPRMKIILTALFIVIVFMSGSLLALGLTFQVGLQMALNVLVVTNTIPNTGISLPFFSYGGTSLVILLLEMGVILSISRMSNKKETL